MSIQINDTIVGLWFVALGNNAGDLLVALAHVGDDFKILGRIRSYNPQEPDNDAWSDKDSKKWFNATNSVPATPEHQIEAVRNMAHNFRDTCSPVLGGKIYEFLRDEKGTQDLTERFFAAPFIHARTEETKL